MFWPIKDEHSFWKVLACAQIDEEGGEGNQNRLPRQRKDRV